MFAWFLSLSLFFCVRFLLLSATQRGLRRFSEHASAPTGQTLLEWMDACMVWVSPWMLYDLQVPHTNAPTHDFFFFFFKSARVTVLGGEFCCGLEKGWGVFGTTASRNTNDSSASAHSVAMKPKMGPLWDRSNFS